MSDEQPSAVDSDVPATYSLRTLYLVVTCFAVACAAFRIADDAVTGFVVAVLFVSGFLTVWFSATGRRRAAGSLMRLTSLALIIGLFLMLIPSTGPHPTSRRSQCSNNLMEIGLAIHAYHQKYGSFPPAYVADAHGKLLVSWRVLILPFLERNSLYQSFRLDQPWDAMSNVKSSQVPVVNYLCPSDPQTLAMSDYLAVVGPNTAWPGAKGSKLSDFKDPSKTILVVEVANSGINWAEPRDLNFGKMAARMNPKTGQGVSSAHPGGANALFADGHVEFIPDDIDPKKLAEMFEIDPPANSEK